MEFEVWKSWVLIDLGLGFFLVLGRVVRKGFFMFRWRFILWSGMVVIEFGLGLLNKKVRILSKYERVFEWGMKDWIWR